MNQNKFVPSLHNASGPVRFNMTNDYMFRAVLQTNTNVLRGLICSLLHLSEEEVLSIKIMNPIILGDSIDNKEFYLDVHVCLNNRLLINLEMQIINQLNWQNRSVLYLCRAFDQRTSLLRSLNMDKNIWKQNLRYTLVFLIILFSMNFRNFMPPIN